MKILYLYSEIVGYLIPIFKEYVSSYNAEVHVIHWDKKKLKPYQPPKLDKIIFYNRSEFTSERIKEFSIELSPDIVYISGWMDKGYLKTAKEFRKRQIPVITGFDDIWTGSLRQKIGKLIFPFVYKKYFSHAWVAGPYQYEFAKKLGFKNSQVIFNLLSANTYNFSNEKITANESAKTFLYVGNYRKVKGVDVLFEAFQIYKNKYKGQWRLVCVGNGDIEELLKTNKDIELFPFSNEKELLDIAKKCSVFILPSRHDQWGVVVHEYTSLGFPLLLSENVGALPTFFINGFNGFLFRNNSPEELAIRMKEMSDLKQEDLIDFGKNSILLSQKINPKISAASFASILTES